MPVTDARILGASCDLTILVLRARKSTRRVSEHAVNNMLAVGSRILGVIVNDVSRRKEGYGYYSYGSYRYGNSQQNPPRDAPSVPRAQNGVAAKLPSAMTADVTSNGAHL
jgi:Mrp family chromosome partitioning ATPase